MTRFQVLAGLQCIIFVTAAASNTVLVVRQTLNQTGPDRDVFSNPSCKSGDCPAKSNCHSSSCCMCHCAYDSPNFLVKRWECLKNADTTTVSSSNTCAFSIRPENEPIEVLLTTEQASGKVKFTSSHVRVNCTNDVIVDRWDYLDVHDQWVQGLGDAFFVSHRTVGGRNQDKKDLSFLQWNKKLESRYSGLLIRLMLKCKNSHRIGCLLAKLNGTYTYDTSATTTSPTTTSPTSQPSGPTQASSQLPRSQTIDLSTSSTRKPTTTVNPNTADQQEQVTNKQERQTSTPGGAIIGVVAGVLAFLCFIILLVVVCRKRRAGLSCVPKERNKKPPVTYVNNADYEDPIYAEVPEPRPDFDNPVYVDPTAGNLNRRTRQDPLPVIPGSDTSYQPLNELTRTAVQPEPTPPPLPTWYPMGIDNEAHDYEGRLQPEIEDYENPSTTNDNSVNASSDYDNPPQPTNSINNSINNTSDYDNPSKTSLPENPHTNNPIKETLDYDNPPQTSLQGKYEQGPGNSSSAVAEEEDGPQYFILEPEDTGM